MAGRKSGNKPQPRKVGTRAKSPHFWEQLGALVRQVRRLTDDISDLRHLASQGVVAAEVIRLQSCGSPESESYEGLRTEALRSLVLAEGTVEKLGLAIDLRTECADKYTLGAASAICDELNNICRGACCRERFPLTPQDVVEGVVEFDLEYPYMVKVSPSGYCVPFGPASVNPRASGHSSFVPPVLRPWSGPLKNPFAFGSGAV